MDSFLSLQNHFKICVAIEYVLAGIAPFFGVTKRSEKGAD